jgi:superfamily I DNA/RNA helicase
MSFHASKGLEWPVVFLSGLEEGLIPLTIYGESDEEEERRLLYVAFTRAREQVILSWAGRRSLQGRPLELPPSSYLRHIPAGLQAPLERSHWRPKRKQEQLSLF